MSSRLVAHSILVLSLLCLDLGLTTTTDKSHPIYKNAWGISCMTFLLVPPAYSFEKPQFILSVKQTNLVD